MAHGYASQLATVATDLFGEVSPERAATGVVDHALRLTDGECGAVTVTSARSKPSVMGASSPEAEKADQLQLEYGEGASREAMVAEGTVVVDDAETDGRWPRWQESIVGLGFRSAMAVRLATKQAPLGTLSLYAKGVGAFSNTAVDIARVYAVHASMAVASAKHASGLRQAIDARHAIGQAQGILMERHGLGGDQAFATLRQRARDQKVSLSEYAVMVINSRGFSPLS
ncbi:GAF and ANTAR domain-containing protein [Haloactinopolyspora sp.]|uniref:GAF and ANTAR domain-containing protein n=1 Tax=Haloactinopolyspora sp. TaxID=1966353 RepID=UPI00261A1897|nr:GAF and ANTAR domain-containing protein [Haloactinopolyspora sp.]